MKTLRTATFLLALAGGLSALGLDFSERELTVTAASDGLRMGATLTAPAEPKAVIVLATGSGTQNRDEELFGKKPFKTIAEYLSSQGYAVLRVDDRGFDNPDDAKSATIATYAGDVASALALADSIYPDIPSGILGHSAGASYAIYNAVHNPATDFIITLAGPAWSGDSVVMSQSRAIAMQLTGRWDVEPVQRRLMEIAKSSASDFTARMMLTTTLSEAAGAAATLPEAQKQIQTQVSGLLTPWYRSFLRYDPSDDIAAVNVPFVALNGSRDLQVLPENLTTIKALNPKADTRLMEGHNHLFQVCQTGMLQEYATLPGDISQETLQTILIWLNRNVSLRLATNLPPSGS